MNRKLLFYFLCAGLLLGFCIAPYLVFFVAPQEAQMGFIQKIFYFHVPCSWAMLCGAVISGVAGAVYLKTGGQRSGALSLAAAELTVIFGVLVLTTGPLWARVAWGHYWVWDARLTTMTVIFLVFLTVLLARYYAGPARRKIAAGLALFGAADVPLIYVSVKLWSTVHPNSVVSTLGPRMRAALVVSLAAISLLFCVLLWLSYELERRRDELTAIAVELAEREG